MSRTYKDKDFYLRFPEEKFDFGRDFSYDRFMWIDRPGVKTKKPRHYSGDWKWYKQTPSWWVREFMTAPKRAACRNWEKQAIYADDFDDLEDCPDFGRKPHVYFY